MNIQCRQRYLQNPVIDNFKEKSHLKIVNDEEISDTYFIVTYASILDTNGNEFLGKSNSLQISEKMFNYVKSGKSLNKVIENILNNNDNKKR